jgi:hypothetical protein
VKKLFLFISLFITFIFLVFANQEPVKVNKSKYKKAIEGMVVDEDGNGIYDATVILVEKNIVTQTSRTGRFDI